jgi:hypothetical protein
MTQGRSIAIAPEAVSPDHGCEYAPKCTDCPWRPCIKELPAPERLAFAAALRVVLRYAEPAILRPGADRGA